MDNLNKKIKKADSLLRKKQPSKAVTFIKEVIKEFPENSYLYYLLGIARMKCCRFFLAKRALEKADSLNPGHSENLRSSGWIKIMLGQLEDGRNDIRRAINLDLTNHLAYLDLAMSYFHFYEFEEGFEWLNRAKELAPKDLYVLNNIKTAEEMKKEADKYSKFDLKLLKKEKTNPEVQRSFRFFMLEKFFKDKALSKDEMEEIKEELELSGLGDKTLIYNDKIDKNLTKETILERRAEIEKELLKLLEGAKSEFTLEDIKDVIYREKGDNELNKIITVFDHGQSMEELNEILQLINDAWNYFPHKCLNGLCPMEKLLKSKTK